MNRRKKIIFNVGIIIMILSVTTFNVSAKTNDIDSKIDNKEFYLGSASITGDGSSSILEAIADNDLLINIDSNSEFVDFYIDYNMYCDGLLDEGTITLSILLNGENSSSNLTATFTNKSGRLYVENVEVTRKDSLLFIIGILYVSVTPVYHNETSATGAGIIAKQKLSVFNFINSFFQFIENHNFKVFLIRELLN